MSGKALTYEERRSHIKSLIYDDLDVSLRQVCRWMGKDKLSEYQYVWQVLSGDYGKSKRSPKLLTQIENELQSRGLWRKYRV